MKIWNSYWKGQGNMRTSVSTYLHSSIIAFPILYFFILTQTHRRECQVRLSYSGTEANAQSRDEKMPNTSHSKQPPVKYVGDSHPHNHYWEGPGQNSPNQETNTVTPRGTKAWGETWPASWGLGAGAEGTAGGLLPSQAKQRECQRGTWRQGEGTVAVGQGVPKSRESVWHEKTSQGKGWAWCSAHWWPLRVIINWG